MSTFDPFDHIPDAPKMTEEQRQAVADKRKAGTIKAEGEGDKKRKSSSKLKREYEARSREAMRELGYQVDRCSRENQYSGKSHDLFGFGDIQGIKPGELLIVQVCSEGGISAHVRKWLTETWAMGGKNSTMNASIIGSVRLALSVPGVRVEIHGWHKVGRFWECRKVDVTEALIDTWQAKRDRRSA